MKAALKLEAIGQNYVRELRSFDRFCSDQIGIPFEKCPYRHGVWEISWGKAVPVRGDWDYSQANSKGSRGVYIIYILDSGKLYQVAEPVSWKRTRHYFAGVNDFGEIIEMDEKEAMEWLSRESEYPY